MYEPFYDAIKRYPILALIRDMSLVRIDLFRDELPDVDRGHRVGRPLPRQLSAMSL
jgi:hypothetical protein